MPYLVAAVVLAGAIGLVDLVLTLGVVRRLRSHTALIQHLLERGGNRRPMLAAGERIGEFAAVSSTGETVTNGSLTGAADSALVGFFTTDCESCLERLPGFARQAEDSEQAIAVFVGEEAAALDLAAAAGLQTVATVISERPGGAVSTAFGVRAFPAVCAVDHSGRILNGEGDAVSGGHRVAEHL